MQTLKEYITSGYGAGVYRKTTLLKEAKKSKAKSKNQLIFLERCIAHDVLPKSFRVRSPLDGPNAERIVKKFRTDLLICAKNGAKRRFFKNLRQAQVIQADLATTLSEDDLAIISRVTDKAQETMFKNSKDKLFKKFEELKKKKPPKISEGNQEQRYVKNPVLNLLDDEVPQHHQELLSLGPKFVPNVKRIPHMDIVTVAECSSLKLEFGNKMREAQTLRKDVLRVLKMAKPVKDNLTKEQRKAIDEIKKDDKVSIYPFDKGAGLVRISTEAATEKIREQLGNTKILERDPTDGFVTKIQKRLSGLRKLGRFTDKEYERMYPSDAIPPRMYGLIKAHKPEKNFPMRLVVSTIGTANYGLSEYLVKISQSTLSKNPIRIKNSQSFVEEAKTWSISPDEVQVSYDVVNLYPSVPVKEAIDVLIDQLNQDRDNLKTITKLKIGEIKDLLELCLSKCYFLYNNEIHELENSGPIGLSLMVSMAESFLQFLENRAIDDALHQQPPISLKTYRRYVDDSHSRFQEIVDASKFLDELNKQDQRIQYTMEVETEGKTLAFLNVETTNNRQGSYDFQVYRKKAITNIQVKPSSSHDPKILHGIFKGFVHQAYKICSEHRLGDEVEFLVNIFKENGYDENILRKLSEEVKNKLNTSTDPTDPTSSEEGSETLQTVTLPWIPGVSPQLKKAFRKAGYKVAFKANQNLKSILSKKNKVKLPPNSHPGIYKIPCACGVPPYVGKTKLKTRTRIDQHEEYVAKEQWERSGAAQHARTCPSGPLFDEATTITTEHRNFERSVREALEIQRHRSAPRYGGINQDDGQYLKTTFWMPFMDLITKEEKERNVRNQLRRQITPTINLTSDSEDNAVHEDR